MITSAGSVCEEMRWWGRRLMVLTLGMIAILLGGSCLVGVRMNAGASSPMPRAAGSIRGDSVLDAIRRFVSDHLVGGPSARPEAEPSGKPSRLQLAACALLLELAHADGEFSTAEQEHIESTLVRHFGLDEATSQELLCLAEAERVQSLDHFQFTRLIAAEYDLRQKMALAEVMWGVILADGKLSDHETHLVRKLASLMQLEPAYLAQARRAAAGES